MFGSHDPLGSRTAFILLLCTALGVSLDIRSLSGLDGGMDEWRVGRVSGAVGAESRWGNIFAAQRKIRELEEQIANLTTRLSNSSTTGGGGSAGKVTSAERSCSTSWQRAELKFQCDDFEICAKQCEETFEMKRRIKQEPYVVSSDGQSELTAGQSCKMIKRQVQSATGFGKYWLKDANRTFEGYCDMSTEEGGWTRFASIAEPKSKLAICEVPASEPFVSKGMFLFSTSMIMDPTVEKKLLVKETVAPFRMHMYDFAPVASTPIDFLAMITGDRGGDVRVWNWVDSKWVSSGEGRCNTDAHSQWNCSPKNGVRFHYPTRQFVQPLGGKCHDEAWDWFTGYSPRYGDLAKLVKNWNGQYDKTPHDFYFR